MAPDPFQVPSSAQGTPGITVCGDRSVRISFARDPGAGAIESLRRALALPPIPGVADIICAMKTVSVVFDPLEADPSKVLAEVRRRLDGAGGSTIEDHPRREVVLPVCYEPPFAPDLASIAERAGLGQSRLIDLHAGVGYTARFLGFSPGFAYLEGLPEALHTPRLESPRTRIEPGSVAVAGCFSGVYPQATPGGWRVIGRTPLRLFDPACDPPSLIGPGDLVRFRPIDGAEFARLIAEQGAGEGGLQ
ncbi:MAG: 5-oxoprolinase subunit PxpB [Phycisphaerales bacterium]|nr:MAG: 5-oxoprolinase subunit PxpB [Phycisphaerales bacterium]